MKLPFLNRHRYLVLKCYTDHAGVYEHSPIRMKTTHAKKLKEHGTTFATCFSRIKSQTLSASVFSPCAMSFEVNEKGLTTTTIQEKNMSVDFTHDSDPIYNDISRNTFLTKILMPWHIEEKTGANFVIARHTENKTMMNVLSGVLNFKASPAIHIFNVVPKINHRYEIPSSHPLASIYPISDLPLHVECFHDPVYFHIIEEKNQQRDFIAHGLKRQSKHEKRK